VSAHLLQLWPSTAVVDRWIGKFERDRLRALADLKKQGETDG
jgi:hypothetical protein